MNEFLKWFYVFISEMLKGFGDIFGGLWSGLKQVFNIKNYIEIFKNYSTQFGALAWILSILAIILVIAVYVLILFMIILMHTEGRCFQIIQSFDTKKGERFALPFALTAFTSSSPS